MGLDNIEMIFGSEYTSVFDQRAFYATLANSADDSINHNGFAGE